MNKIRPFFLLLLTSLLLNAQSVYVPVNHWIYDLLDRWEAQSYIDNVYNHTRPYSRVEVAEYLDQVFEKFEQTPTTFTSYDKQYIDYAAVEFREELERQGTISKRPKKVNWFETIRETKPIDYIVPDLIYANNRNFLHKTHEELSLFAEPLFQVSRFRTLTATDTLTETNIWSTGVLFYGTLGQNFGFYFNLTDNHFFRDVDYPHLEVLEESGLPYHTRGMRGEHPQSFDINENVAYLNITHKYFSVMFGRDYNQWGSGRRSQLMLSTNAPIYDQIKLSVRYWRFKYTHITAFLQYISPEARLQIKNSEPIDTYWAGNRLEFYIAKNIQLGLQESVVYGNQSLKPGYLNPIAFYKSVEHFNGDRDNGGLGIDLAWRVFPGFKVTGEWFMDDLSTDKLGSNFFGNKFGWQGGALWVDPLGLPGSDIMFEYARIKPYVYSHTVQDYNKYKHYDTILGHYIGPNSDDVYLRLRYAPHRRVRLELDFERYRHGQNVYDDTTFVRNVGGDADRGYQYGDARETIFLDGDRIERKVIGGEVRFEWLRNSFLTLGVHRLSTSNSATYNMFRFRISYNFAQRDERMPYFEPAKK